MQMSGQIRVPAPQRRVWDALNDPEVLRACVPGCEAIERTSANGYTTRVVAKVGPVKAKFSGKLNLTDLKPPKSYRIEGEGAGGVAGFAKGGATVRLEPDGRKATIVHYDVSAQVGGKIAQIGSRLIDSTARKMADDFFARFSEVVAGTEAGKGVRAPAAAERRVSVGDWRWVAAAMAAAIVVFAVYQLV